MNDTDVAPHGYEHERIRTEVHNYLHPPTVRIGNPDESVISTSYVERFNLSTRVQSRRFYRNAKGELRWLEDRILGE